MVTRIAGSLRRRKGAPGATAQPWVCSACTDAGLVGDGIQTFRPLEASALMPCSAKAEMNASRRLA